MRKGQRSSKPAIDWSIIEGYDYMIVLLILNGIALGLARGHFN